MSMEQQEKIRPMHLGRPAYLYVRQSSLKQVFENTESRLRQYDLRGRAVALGWPADSVVVIDSDLGKSGASAADRQGFQRLVTDVGLGRVGLVMGLEVSRLARKSSDWHRLVEICALAETLILDEDGLYDPNCFNDRLLLGLKGTMSEVELHLLRSRMRGALLNKARRGELAIPLPAGLVYTPDTRVVLDTDRRVQESLRTVFETFLRTGAAYATLRALEVQGVLLPLRVRSGPRRGELAWRKPDLCRIIDLLHNPRYAGAYCYGRTKHRQLADGTTIHRKVKREDWFCLLRDAHPGYITWEQFEANQRQLLRNAQGRREDGQRQSPPREGPALLQGLLLCGKCGHRMTVSYWKRKERRVPAYLCCWQHSAAIGPQCQAMAGERIDRAVGELLIELMTPATLDVAMAVEQEMQSRLEEAERLRALNVQQAHYETDTARHRFMQVDPNNRLVADELEADWNRKLRQLREAQAEFQRLTHQDRTGLSEARRAAVLRLATDFPAVWNSPATPPREKKRLLRLLVEDVTLIRNGQIVTAHVRLRGGATRTLTVRLRKSGFLEFHADPALVAEYDRLLDEHDDEEIAEMLNRSGFRSGHGHRLSTGILKSMRNRHHLRSHHARLRDRGLLNKQELAAQLGVSPSTITNWACKGRVEAVPSKKRGLTLYKLPVSTPLRKYSRTTNHRVSTES